MQSTVLRSEDTTAVPEVANQQHRLPADDEAVLLGGAGGGEGPTPATGDRRCGGSGHDNRASGDGDRNANTNTLLMSAEGGATALLRSQEDAAPLAAAAAAPADTAVAAAAGGDRRQGLQRAKSKSWRQLADYVNTGEILVASPSLVAGGTGSNNHNHNNTIHNATPLRSRTPSCDSLETAESRRKERETILQHKRWQFQRLANFTLTQCLLALLLHVLIAVLAFSFVLHQWSIVDSVYFAVVTFSLVGFGDLFPQSHAARFFTCAYALAGVTCLGIAIGVVSSNVAEAQEHALQEAKDQAKKRALALFTDDPIKRQWSSASSSGGTHHQPPPDTRSYSFSSCSDPTSEPPSCPSFTSSYVRFLSHAWRGCVQPLTGANARMVCAFAAVVLVLLAFGVVISHDPAMAPSDIPYFVIVTATTLGFGEVVPISPSGRLATALFIPLAVGAMGHWLAIVAKFIVDRRQSSVRRHYLESQVGHLTAADLHAMDSDDDGNVSRSEFVEFMLLAMSKVDKSLLEELRNHFDRLDADKSGLLSKSDLIQVARRKLKSPARKLELSRYKTRLLKQGAAAASTAATSSSSATRSAHANGGGGVTNKPTKEVSWWTQSGQKLMDLLNPEVDGEGGIDRDAGAYQPVPDPHCPGTTTVPPERVPNHSWNKAAQAQNPGGGSNPPPSRPSSMDALPGNGDLTEDLLGEPERREVV